MKKAIDLHKKKERNRTENNSNRFVPSREVREGRFKKKQEKKSRWSMKEGSHETIMFTEMTEDSELKNRIQIAAKRNKIKIKVQERPGTKLKSILQKSDPFSEKGCKRIDCAICQESTNKINCRTRGCVYELLCKQCESHTNVKSQYRGQTSRSLYERFNEHFDNLKKKKEDSPLWKHAQEYHEGGTFPIEVKILKRCNGRPTKRMITEVVLIEDMKDSKSLNNKKEYGYVRIPKVNIET